MKHGFWFLAAAGLAWGQSGTSIDVTKITHGLEQHYNGIKSLRVNFSEQLVDRGGRHVPLKGTLSLEKPRKMRWEYAAPNGGYFLSDGEYDYDFNATKNEVERNKLKDSDDLRGPLAFLLGKVDFDRDFGSYTTGAADGSITAIPKSDKSLFSQISFIATPDSRIKQLSIKGQDGSTSTFVFDGEMDNVPMNPSLFKFTRPPGAVVVDAKQ